MAGDSVQKIKEQLSIVDVISPYVELHKAGKNFKGKSPFTNEKTPSFYVSPDRGMYFCFSSSQGGDIFTFVQKMEGVDFKGALKILADKAGVELVPEDPKKRDRRDTLYQALEEATSFFESELADNEEATKYLDDRVLTKETIKRWRIGYAQNDWRQLKEYLNKKGFADDILLSAGLVKQADSGKQPYDVFRDRIMFPIMDSSGRVVGFSGRILSKDSEAAKYINSPETELFNKSEILFGYDKAKNGIHKLDFSLVVEGQFDVVLSHQAGYNNAVAVSGTALTLSHASLLQRLSNRIVLALDADRAGVSAVKRAASVMLPRGIDLKVARLHGGKDPADLIKEDPKLFKKDIGGATHVIEFLLEVLKEDCKDDRMYKIRARDEILPYLKDIESAIERDHFAGKVAEAIDTTTEAIRLELARMDSVKSPARPAEAVVLGDIQSPKVVLTRKEDLLTFLAVAEGLLDISEQHMLRERFLELLGESPDEVRARLPIEKVSEMTFTIEQHWNEINPKFIREEWEERMQQLSKILTKEKVAKARTELLKAEQEGDEAKRDELLVYLGTLGK
ncbi:MAG: DNA primase [Candidatus Paceibacterota bacterium]